MPTWDEFARALPRATARATTGLVKEAGWVATHLATYPLGLLADRGPRPRHGLAGLSVEQRGLAHRDLTAAGTPILLVHGIVDNHTIFNPLRRALDRRGFAQISSFDYGLLTSDVVRTAARLGTVIEELTEQTGYERLHVIGHSLGGLLARYYVQRLGGDERVHTLVTLGTPHQGTELARIGSAFPLVRQLRPDSTLMRTLAEPAPDCSTRFVCFHSDLDQLVVPSRNARLIHPDLDVTNVTVPGVGHLSLTNHRGIAAQIAELLSEIEPHCSSPAPTQRLG
ncbi:MAG: esterase/lipase family protein [Propionibacteriaceae bacterium]